MMDNLTHATAVNSSMCQKYIADDGEMKVMLFVYILINLLLFCCLKKLYIYNNNIPL